MKSFDEYDPLLLTLGKRSMSYNTLISNSRKRQRIHVVSPPPSTRHVRFHDTVVIHAAATPHGSNEDDDECQQQWYSTEDYANFRNQAAATIRNCYRQQQQEAASSSSHFSQVLQRTYEACLTSDQGLTPADILTVQEHKELLQLLSSSDDDSRLECLGLERAIVRSIGKDRALRRQQVTQAARLVQQSPGWCDVDTRAVALRLRCQAISWTSTIFAQCLAMAVSASSSCQD